MAGYSSDEIEGAASQFVTSDISVTRDALGPIDLDAKFSEAVQLISYTLIFDPNAIFYLVYLATNRLNVDVLAAVTAVQDILTAISEMGRITKKVEQTTLLGNAAAALSEVDLNLTKAVNATAMQKYVNAIDAFRDLSLAPNMKSGSQVVRPPQEARTSARSSLATLSSIYPDMLDRLDTITTMVPQLYALSLPAKTIRDTTRKSRKSLLDLKTQFDTQISEDAKISMTRSAYLTMTAGKSVLNGLTTLRDPMQPRMVSSNTLRGQPVLGDLFVPASCEGTTSGPWIISTGVNDQLSIAVDGGAPQAYTLSPPPYPEVENSIAQTYVLKTSAKAYLTSANTGPFIIPGTGNVFVVLVDGERYTCPVNSGSRTTDQIVSDLTTGLPYANLVITNSSNHVRLEHTSVGAHNITIGEYDPITTPVNAPLGFLSNPSNTGVDANNLMEVDGLPITLPTGSTVTAAQVATAINTALGSGYLATDDSGSVLIKKVAAGAQSITITAQDVLTRDAVLRCYNTLGFFEGQTDTSFLMSAAEVANQLDGYFLSTVHHQDFEHGGNGIVVSTTRMNVPTGTLPTSRAGDTLVIINGSNAGHHKISSTSTDRVIVDASTPFTTTTSVENWKIIRESLVLTSKSTALVTKISVGSGTANSTLGLTVSDHYGQTSGFQALESGVSQDFYRYNIEAQDVLTIISPALTSIISRVAIADKRLEVSPMLATNLSNLSFTIVSADEKEYETFVSETVDWETRRTSSNFSTDTAELDRVMNPLLSNSNPSLSQINDARVAATELLKLLQKIIISDPDGISDILVEFVVRVVPRIDAALRMLQERGMDRAYDSILDGNLTDFFGYTKDDASNAAYMLKSIRGMVQNDIPISRSDPTAADPKHDVYSINSTDPTYDLRDVDRDDAASPIGELPELDAGEKYAGPNYYKETY